MKQFIKPTISSTIMPILILFALVNLLQQSALARDLGGAVQEAGTSLKEIVFKLAIVFFIIAGAAFMISMRAGVERLTAVIIGTFIAGSATTFVALVSRWTGGM